VNATGENYLQFPLCALAYGAEVKPRLENLIGYGFVEAGHVLLNRLTGDVRALKIDELSRLPKLPTGTNLKKDDHVAALLGSRQIGITFGYMPGVMEEWQTLRSFRWDYEKVNERDVEVRIAKDLVFETRDNRGMSYREFSVLAALYSSIGAKKYPVRITRDRIQCRQLGYKSPAIMQVELPKRTDGAKPLSLHQINYTLNALHERRFFARARANERQTFYSHRMTQEQLEEALIAGKAYSRKFHDQRRQRDAALMLKVKQQAKTTIEVNGLLK